MALLCNMHADGPATIKLLRCAGYTTLADIARAPHERVADLLGVSPPYARRFVREARLLAERTGECALDREESADRESAPFSGAATSFDAAGAPAETASERAPIAREGFAPTLTSDRETLARRISAPAFVSRIQTTHDTGRDVASDEEVRSREERMRSRPERAFASIRRELATAESARGEDREPVFDIARTAAERAHGAAPNATASTAARVLPSTGTPLRAGGVEGLDAAWCDRLVAQGILTLETLVDAPGLKLAKRLGVPLTELMNLQVLAQGRLAARRDLEREATDSADSNPSAERDYVLVPARPALRRAEDLGAAHAEDSDAHGFAASTSAPSDRADEVGGPFA